MHSFVNIKTILGPSPDSYRRLFGSGLGSNCLQRLLIAIFFVSRSRQTDLLIELYARVIAPAIKVKMTNLFAEIKRLCHRDSSKCLSE